MAERTVNIEDELRLSYLDYAMSVIVGRAIPDVRDGLKPVHRRILFSMFELGNDYNRPYKKSARIVGDVVGKYHPHGDAAVYDALVRMAQDFSMRYPIVDGQGNFGSVDGDPPAAMRYTEVRMAKIAHEFMKDIEKNTVPFQPNYDNTMMEPVVLPTRIPNLIVNGSSGIAVGMATNIPPHNLREVSRALMAYLENPDISVSEIMKIMPGPDFPTGGIILGLSEIKNAYETGRGVLKLRGKVTVEELKGKKKALVITEIPFQLNKAKLIERIAELVKEKKIEGIQDIRDESDREGLRVVLTLRADENPKVIENQLYKFTPLEVSFGVTMLAVVNGRPEILNIKEIFAHFLNFRRQVIIKRTEHDLKKAEERAHILEGFKIALNNLDAVIETIKKSLSPQEAKEKLVKNFELTEIQAQAILDLKLQRLTALEQEKIIEEYKAIIKEIDRYKQILSSPTMINHIIKEELKEIDENYGDERRTVILPEEGTLEWMDIIPEKDVVVVLTKAGYIKRTPLQTYRNQRRGGKGKKGITTKEEDFTSLVITASTHDTLLVFTNTGRMYWLNVRDIPEMSSVAQGKAIVNLLNFQPGEKVATVLPIPSGFTFKDEPDSEESEHLGPPYVFLATKQGIVKKMSLHSFSRPISRGVKAITLGENDELIKARLTMGNNKLFFMSDLGKALLIEESSIRPMGRSAQGVRGINTAGGNLIGMEVYNENMGKDLSVLVISEKGFGKRTLCSEFRTQGRGGIGVTNFNVTPKTGKVRAFCVVTPEDEILIITNLGRLIRLNVSDIRVMRRITQGVKLMELEEEEEIVDVTVVSEVERIIENNSTDEE